MGKRSVQLAYLEEGKILIWEVSFTHGGAWSTWQGQHEAHGACASAWLGITAAFRRHWIRLVKGILHMWSLVGKDGRKTSNDPFSLLLNFLSLLVCVSLTMDLFFSLTAYWILEIKASKTLEINSMYCLLFICFPITHT